MLVLCIPCNRMKEKSQNRKKKKRKEREYCSDQQGTFSLSLFLFLFLSFVSFLQEKSSLLCEARKMISSTCISAYADNKVSSSLNSLKSCTAFSIKSGSLSG